LHLFSGRDVKGKLLSVSQLIGVLENRGTAVIYMGTKVLEDIWEKLDALQRETITTTIVSRAGHISSQLFEGNLNEMVKLNIESPIKTPAIIYLRKGEEFNQSTV